MPHNCQYLSDSLLVQIRIRYFEKIYLRRDSATWKKYRGRDSHSRVLTFFFFGGRGEDPICRRRNILRTGKGGKIRSCCRPVATLTVQHDFLDISNRRFPTAFATWRCGRRKQKKNPENLSSSSSSSSYDPSPARSRVVGTRICFTPIPFEPRAHRDTVNNFYIIFNAW